MTQEQSHDELHKTKHTTHDVKHITHEDWYTPLVCSMYAKPFC